MSKKELLKRTLEELRASTELEPEHTDMGTCVFNVIKAAKKALQQGDGLVWDEVIDIIEEVFPDDLSHLRPPKCPDCGSAANRDGNCGTPNCKNSVWYVDYDKQKGKKKNERSKAD